MPTQQGPQPWRSNVTALEAAKDFIVRSLALATAVVLALLLQAAPADAQPAEPEPETHPNWHDVRVRGEAVLARGLESYDVAVEWTGGFGWDSHKESITAARSWGWFACGIRRVEDGQGATVGRRPFWLQVRPDGAIDWGWAGSSWYKGPCDRTKPRARLNRELRGSGE